MLLAHKLLDAMRAGEVVYTDGTRQNEVDLLYRGIIEAEKFSFEQLLLERAENVGTFHLPDLTTDEKQFWIDGLIFLPAPTCWFEYKLGESWTGLLVTDGTQKDPDDLKWKTDRLWCVMGVDLKADGKFHFTGLLLGLDRDNCLAFHPVWTAMANGNLDFWRGMTTEDKFISHASLLMVSVYLALMLNSRTSEMRKELAPPKLNKQRLLAHKAPLFDHHVITLVPKRFLAPVADRGGTHAPPKLHWRNSHKRHFAEKPASGRAVWMPNEAWMGNVGWWVTIIPRYLVGHADLGEVSREFRWKADA